MRPPSWIRIGKPRREGSEVVHPLSVDLDGLMTADELREGQRRLREAGWTAEEFAEGLRRAALNFGMRSHGSDDPQYSDDPGLSPDAARWTPEDDA